MKRIQKKLSLNRETVRTLSVADMRAVAGGTDDTEFAKTRKQTRCRPCDPTTGPGGTGKSDCYSCTPICNTTDIIVE